MTPSVLDEELEDRVVVRLNRPEHRNAIDLRTVEELQTRSVPSSRSIREWVC